jgi:hypothetical protein
MSDQNYLIFTKMYGPRGDNEPWRFFSIFDCLEDAKKAKKYLNATISGANPTYIGVKVVEVGKEVE